MHSHTIRHIIYLVRQHNLLISKVNKTRYIIIYVTYLLFFITLEHLWIFISHCFEYHQVGDAFEGPYPVAPHLMRDDLECQRVFSDFFPLWMPICSLIHWGGSFSWQTAWGSCSVLSIDCINRFRVFAMTLTRIWVGILALTRRQIGRMGWPELPLQIAPYWNEALGEMFSQKRHLPCVIFKTVWKKNSKML